MSAEKANWAKVAKFVWIEGTEDTVVWPRAGEQWSAVAPGYPKHVAIAPMKETKWYTEDTFGLKTADEAGKIVFDSTPGNHLQFSKEDLIGWINKYFV